MFRSANQKLTNLKVFILSQAEKFIEPQLWKEFRDSENPKGNAGYKIYDDDLPNIRDLKAFINMLIARERITATYSLFTLTVFKTMQKPMDILDFRRNYRIYMSTISPLSHYWDQAKEILMMMVFPVLKTKFGELLGLCTSENFQIAAEFFIEQIITLEQFQEKYAIQKLEKSAEPSESVITALTRNIDDWLKQIYKEDYAKYFEDKSEKTNPDKAIEVKESEKKEADKKEAEKKETEKKDGEKPLVQKQLTRDYYPEKKLDETNPTIKHIKKLANAIIGVGKFIDIYAQYGKSTFLTGSSGHFLNIIYVLSDIYKNLKEFDYKAIFAHQSKPLAEVIKKQFQEFNKWLEKAACFIDKLECETCLKEGVLLQHFEKIIKRYNQIIDELKIPINYSEQKHLFRKARLKSRQEYREIIQNQLGFLNHFLFYKDYALAKIPSKTIQTLQAYIIKYGDEICVDRAQLAKYQRYLADVLKLPPGADETFAVAFERIGNVIGMTIHHNVMDALRKRQLFLTKLDRIMTEKIDQMIAQQKDHPYEFFNLDELKGSGHHKYIIGRLQWHTGVLHEENKELTKSAVPKTSDDKSVVTKLPDEKATQPKLKSRWVKLLASKGEEHGRFEFAIEEHKKHKDLLKLLGALKEIKKEVLCSRSMLLIDELEMIVNTTKIKPFDEDELSLLEVAIGAIQKDKLTTSSLQIVAEIEKLLEKAKKEAEQVNVSTGKEDKENKDIKKEKDEKEVNGKELKKADIAEQPQPVKPLVKTSDPMPIAVAKVVDLEQQQVAQPAVALRM